MLVLTAGRARAEPLRALVRVADASDSALVERVRGQTSDLDVRLERVDNAPLEPSFGEQLNVARFEAEGVQASVVVWFVRRPPALEVVVADLRADRVLVREIGGGEGALARSAQEEAAALVVRSAFKASLLGAALGEPEDVLVAEAREPAPPPPPPRPAPPPPVVAPPAPEPPRRAPLAVRLGLGAEGGFERARPNAYVGLAGRLALARDRWEVGVRGGFGLPSSVRLQSDVARLSLAQHRVSAYAGYVPWLRDTVRVVLGASAGMHLFRTRITPEDARFREREQRQAVAALGADVTLLVLPRFTAGRLGIALRVGGEAFPEPLVIGYEAPAFVQLARLWTVQPVAGVELVLPLY